MNNNACYLLHDVRLRLIQYPQGGPGGRHTPDLRPVTDLCGDGSGGRGGGKRRPGWWLHRMSRWGCAGDEASSRPTDGHRARPPGQGSIRAKSATPVWQSQAQSNLASVLLAFLCA
jgi:hypothetical protein